MVVERVEFPLPEVIDFQEGPGILAVDFRETGVPLIRLSGLERGFRVLDGCNYLDPTMVAKRWSHFKVESGDVLLSTSASLGRTAIVDKESAGSIPYTGIIRMRPRRKEQLSAVFIPYLLQSPQFQQQVEAVGVGSVFRHFGPSHLRHMTVVLPPLAEQLSIAHVLKALDSKVEVNQRMNETLDSIVRALFKSWFVDFDPVRAKAEGRAPMGMDATTASLFPSEFKDSLPIGWRSGHLGEFVELQRGTTYKSALKGLPGPVLLGLGSIQRNGGFREDKLSTYGGESPGKLLVFPGELFVSLKDVTQSADLLGAVARVPRHIANGRLTQDTVKLEFGAHELIREVVYRTLLTPEYREYCRQHATGTTNLGLSRDDFLAYPVVVAPAPVIRAFNESVQALTLRAELAVIESRTLASLRDQLLPGLLSGEIDVSRLERTVEDRVS